MLMLVARGAAVDRALEHVSDDVNREVFVLWMKGRDNFQIAAEVGAPYNTVRSRLSRAKAQVLAALQAELDR